jgi:hypothetical protein
VPLAKHLNALNHRGMVQIVSQRDLRAVRDLPFCYLCGVAFTGVESDVELDHDHAPPKAIFAMGDRNPPLKLKTHKACNGARSESDDLLGQLIGLRRGEAIGHPKRGRIGVAYDAQRDLAAVTNVPIEFEIWRWVRAFHAALYREFMPETRERAVTTPLPRAVTINGVIVPEPVKPQHYSFVATLRHNRSGGSVDVVCAYNGKLRYECVWVPDNSRTEWLGIFGLELCQWNDLGAAGDMPARACVGVYQRVDHQAPSGATLGVQPEHMNRALKYLDPFTDD